MSLLTIAALATVAGKSNTQGIILSWGSTCLAVLMSLYL